MAACDHFGGRLPTEAEWEYAARAGRRTAWSFGDDKTKLDEYAWYETNSGSKPHPVGTKKANAWGLHDMHGNVWEWVIDWYGPYLSAAQRDPTGPTTGTDRVMRGGSFLDLLGGVRSAARFEGGPPDGFGYPFLGFRCAHASSRKP